MNRHLVLSLLAASLLFTGCGPNADPSGPGRVTSEDVKRDSRQAADTARKYTQQKKAEYEKQLRADLTLLDKQIDDWKASLKDKSAAARAEADKQIKDLEKERAEFQKKLDRLTDHSQDAWEDLKEGADKALNDLKESLRKAKEKVK